MKLINIELIAQKEPELGLTNPGLTSHLMRVRNGSAPTPRSWLYEDIAPERILNSTKDIIESFKGVPSRIVTDDLHYVDKFGPQGGTEPWSVERENLFSQSFESQDNSPLFETKLWIKAKDIAIQRLKFRRNLRPKALESVVEEIRRKGGLSTNSGLPHFTRRSGVVKEAIQDAKSGKWKIYPAVIGSRSMRQAERNIFMYPFSTNLNGSTYQQVVQTHIRNLNLPEFAAWEGMDAVEKSIQPFMSLKLFKLSSDYSKMDNWFRLQHTREVWDVVRHAFQPQYDNSLWETMSHTHTIRIVTPDGVTTEEHGVASGSEWTNFLETVFQFIFWIYIDLKREEDGLARIVFVSCQGDDAIAFSEEPLANSFLDAVDLVKFKANADKQHESTTEVHYLRRWFYTDYTIGGKFVGVYPLTLAINAAVYPERFHDPKVWDGQMFVIRTLMILENPMNHPEFRPFAEYVLKGNQKHFSEFAKLPPRSVAHAEAKARDIAGLIPSYNQEKMEKKLVDFESYKILKSIY